ncbi:hypothetical protein GGH12_000722 [Coemansia sp. RSA 1822]|nr:hypothetical protein LPJ76_002105 [Coemansia sp. RSA 638]KAJ2566764.1 hypothetical protein GGH12_000722 [Coemansia sp. RSA 1822]
MLTVVQVDAFHTRGYVVVRGFLSESEIASYTEEAETLVNHCYELGDIVSKWGCVVEPFGCGYLDSIPHLARTTQRSYLATRAQITSAPALCTLSKYGMCARQLLEPSSVVLLNEQYVVKPPRSKAAFDWHQDVLYFKEEQREHRIVSVWTPLCDVREENGTVLVDPFPDSLRPGVYPRGPEPIAVEMDAGCALFMDGRLRHCSGANTSREFRTAYMPQFSSGQISDDNGLTALAVPVNSD